MKIFILFFILLVLELIYSANSACILSALADNKTYTIATTKDGYLPTAGGAGGVGK
jgi:hypothetical protein